MLTPTVSAALGDGGQRQLTMRFRTKASMSESVGAVLYGAAPSTC